MPVVDRVIEVVVVGDVTACIIATRILVTLGVVMLSVVMLLMTLGVVMLFFAGTRFLARSFFPHAPRRLGTLRGRGTRARRRP